MINNKKQPNILILGASGGVAQAFLQILNADRDLFGKIILLDKVNTVTHSEFINHKKIDYIFLNKAFSTENIYGLLSEIKIQHEISIVLDMTDQDTLPTLKASDDLGLSYLNCSVNYEAPTMETFVADIEFFSQRFNHATHILSLGMNPGIADHLLKKGILEHGIPKEFTEVEYETGIPKKDPGMPFVMWSKLQFLTEAVWDPSGYCNETGQYLETNQPAIYNLTETREFIEPIKTLDTYPLGMIVPHDEIISFAHQLEIPGKFIYALHPLSQNRLIELANKKGYSKVSEEDIFFADNISTPLLGSDLITFWLSYEDKKVCYYVDVEHQHIKGTSATLFMVAVGVLSGLLTFITKPPLENSTYLAADLDTDIYLENVKKNMNIRCIEC